MAYQHGVTRIAHAVGILSDTVDPYHRAQVFDGPRLQQYPPGVSSWLRPVGDAQDGVILKMLFWAGILAQPHGKAQVIANREQNAKVFESDNDTVVPHGIALMLTGHAKQVALVIMNKRTVRSCPDQTVDVLARLDNRHAAGDDTVALASLLKEPGHGATLHHGFGHFSRIHGKTGRKHLGQNDKIGCSAIEFT